MRFVPILVSCALLLSAVLFGGAEDLLDKPDRWFRSDDGRGTLACVLSWQADEGGWPKNEDTTRKPYDGDRDKLQGTFDNKATTGELRLLARAFEATGEEEYRSAFLKGFDHILDAQYENGGWPQFHPPGDKYHRHITFNDGAMVRLLEFLRDSQEFEVMDRDRRRKADEAFERGIDCILKCQIVIDGEPTVWCAQHHAVTLEPVLARAYELPSLSGAESAGILRFLMSIERPSREIRRAIEGGVEWFEEAAIENVRFVRDKQDGRLVEDRGAAPVWARFYDLETGQPIFCGRDGVKKFDLAEIELERRKGYAWYGNWGESVAREFAKWKRKH